MLERLDPNYHFVVVALPTLRCVVATSFVGAEAGNPYPLPLLFFLSFFFAPLLLLCVSMGVLLLWLSLMLPWRLVLVCPLPCRDHCVAPKLQLFDETSVVARCALEAIC